MEDSQSVVRIMILEDNPDDRELMERQLRKNGLHFVSECVDTCEEFTAALDHFNPDIVLSDHGLPQFNSVEALKIIKASRPDLPFILVTGTMSEDFAISTMLAGAQDYILKSNLSRLPSAIRRAIHEKTQEREKKEAEQALKKQNEELLKANNELDHFVYSVSHNLRGPLASVLGLLNVANLEEKTDKLAHILALMETSVLKLDDTLKEIIDYSRNSRKDIEAQEINWRVLIEHAFKRLEYLHPDEPLTTTLHIEGEVPFYSDYARLEVIMNNLLSNAIIYRRHCTPLSITITVTQNPENAKVTICDNGTGIEEIALPKIFDMFYRGSNNSRGAGLGLYIVKEMLHKLGGDICIHAVPSGVGTAVMFTLPRL